MISSRRILNLMICLIGSIMCVAAESGDKLTASKVFADAPLEVLDMIRPSTRLDMLDYYTQADSILTAPDAFGGKSRLELMTDDYMRVAVSPMSTLEIKILPYKKDVIVMAIYTVGDDSIAKDSRISFYDSQLQPLPLGNFIKTPDDKKFFNLKNSDISDSEIDEWIPFKTIMYSTGPGDTPLTATLTSIEILPTETRERLEKVVVPTQKAFWSGNNFKF